MTLPPFRFAALSCVIITACWGNGCAAPHAPSEPRSRAAANPTQGAPRLVSIVGTNDLHGHVEQVASFAGYVKNLRNAQAARGGGVVLVDAGDLFQGTLESNLNEGAAVVQAYNHIGYTAAAVGNHEFDFGPVGEAATANPGEDPRGALSARSREARFPFLAANVIDTVTEEPIDLDNMMPSTLVEVAGVPVGIVGVTTEDTPRTTLVPNFVGLRIRPLAETIIEEATRLRQKGARIVVVAAHAGGRCEACHDPYDVSTCKPDQEIFRVAEALPRGLVDVIVGGHTHAMVAHFVNGVAIIESYALGRAFGRVDVLVPESPAEPNTMAIFAPQTVCGFDTEPENACDRARYEGAQVEQDHTLVELLTPAFRVADHFRERSLNVHLAHEVKLAYTEESALGNLFADLMRNNFPHADVAVTNAGGLRANLPAGPLVYGSLFEAMPFDNRFAELRIPAHVLARVIAKNLQREKGILLVSGVRAEAVCVGGELQVRLAREDGAPIDGDQTLTLITSDFLAHGGDSAFSSSLLGEDAIQMHTTMIRDGMADQLRSRGGTIDPQDPSLFDPRALRVRYEGKRPVRCE